MKHKSKSDAIAKKLSRQQHLLNKYRREDARLRWAVGVASIIILLILLLFGFATDWTAGLRKSKVAATVTPTAAQTVNAGDSPATPAEPVGTTSKTATGTDGTDATKTATGTTDSASTTTQTTNGGSDTGTTTMPQPNSGSSSAPPSSDLLDLYTNSSPGDNINSILQDAGLTDIPSNCQTNLLVQTCDFTQSGNSVSVKDIAGTGLVTSVTKNF